MVVVISSDEIATLGQTTLPMGGSKTVHSKIMNAAETNFFHRTIKIHRTKGTWTFAFLSVIEYDEISGRPTLSVICGQVTSENGYRRGTRWELGMSTVSDAEIPELRIVG